VRDGAGIGYDVDREYIDELTVRTQTLTAA
jgi:hypothetical protein